MSNIRKQRKANRNVGFNTEEVAAFGDFFSALLFNQIVWLSENQANGGKFYKFFKPCSHQLCRNGDTWEEFFGVSYYRFNKSLKVFAQKVSKGAKKDNNALVWYWIGIDRVPYFLPNWKAIELFWNNAHPDFKLRNSEGANYHVNSTVEITQLAPSELDNSILVTDNQYSSYREAERKSAPAQDLEQSTIDCQSQSETTAQPAAPLSLTGNPAFAPLFEQAKKQGLTGMHINRLLLLLSTPSTDLTWAINQLPAKERVNCVSDFVSDPKFNSLTTGADLRARFRKYASSWARNANKAPTGYSGRTLAASTSSILPRY